MVFRMQALIQGQNDVLNECSKLGFGLDHPSFLRFYLYLPFRKIFCASIHNMCAVNSSPYALSIPHQTCFGEGFSGTPYAVQLFTKSAELGYSKVCYYTILMMCMSMGN